jgi:hypothetical protein
LPFTLRSLIDPEVFSSMLRSLVQGALLILILETLLFGQGVAGDQKASLSAPGSASPSTTTPGGFVPSI